MTRSLSLLLVGGCLALGCKRGPEVPLVDPKVEADGLYLRGSAEYLKGDFEAALRSFEEVEKRVPSDPRLPAARGEIYLSQGRWGDALAHFQDAVQRNPQRQTNWARLGFVQLRLGQRDSARVSLEKALAMAPKDWQSREQLAELYQELNDLEKSSAALRQAALDAPDAERPRLVMRLAEKLKKAGANDRLFALVAEEKAAGKAKPELFALSASAHLAANALPEAADDYRAAAEAAKGDASFWELLGEVEFKRNRLDEADQAFKKALEAQDLATVHIARMRLFLKRNDRAKAMTELDSALKVATGDEPRETLELAEGLLLANRKEDALKLLSTVAAVEAAREDLDLQRRTAELARSLGREEIRAAACARLVAPDGGTPLLKSPACR